MSASPCTEHGAPRTEEPACGGGSYGDQPGVVTRHAPCDPPLFIAFCHDADPVRRGTAMSAQPMEPPYEQEAPPAIEVVAAPRGHAVPVHFDDEAVTVAADGHNTDSFDA